MHSPSLKWLVAFNMTINMDAEDAVWFPRIKEQTRLNCNSVHPNVTTWNVIIKLKPAWCWLWNSNVRDGPWMGPYLGSSDWSVERFRRSYCCYVFVTIDEQMHKTKRLNCHSRWAQVIEKMEPGPLWRQIAGIRGAICVNNERGSDRMKKNPEKEQEFGSET